jgi:O-antigen/teichoic acid export membrane protein
MYSGLNFFHNKLNTFVLSVKKFNNFFSNSFWLLAEKFHRALLGLLVGAWVARYLGPQNYGNLAFAVSYIAFFQAVVTLGNDGLIVRDILKNKESDSNILGTVFAMRIVLGFIAWIIAVVLCLMLYGYAEPIFILITVLGSIIFFQAGDTIDLWFQSQNKSKYTAWAKFFSQIVSNIFKIIFVLTKAPLIFFAFALGVDGLLIAIGLIFIYKFHKTNSPWSFDLDRSKLIFKESWPYLISGASTMLYMRIDQYMLQHILGSYVLGIYAVALPISQVWYVIPVTLTVILAPYLTKRKINNEFEYQKTLSMIFRYFGISSLLLSCLISYFAKDIISFLYGTQYAESGLILSVHVFTNFFVFQSQVQNLWFVNEGKGLNQSYQTLLGLVTALIANYFLITNYGVLGAAYASILAYAVSGVLSNLIFAPRIFLMQIGFFSFKAKLESN